MAVARAEKGCGLPGLVTSRTSEGMPARVLCPRRLVDDDGEREASDEG